MGADGIELDVHLLEGEIIVIHDSRLDRTTNGAGPLSRRSLAYVRALDAGQGERVPLLREVLETVDAINPAALVNIELKGRRTAGPTAALLHEYAARQGGSMDRYLLSSFHRAELRLLCDSGLRLGILFARSSARFRKLADALHAWSIHIPLRHASAKVVDRIHAHGQKVFVYTVNASRDFTRLQQMGVDGIFTDYPDRFLTGPLPPGKE
jgi:glycerophosphoryl diester phosphodiesterase